MSGPAIPTVRCGDVDHHPSHAGLSGWCDGRGVPVEAVALRACGGHKPDATFRHEAGWCYGEDPA